MIVPALSEARAHRGHARAVLGRGRLEQRAEDRDLHVLRDEPAEDLGRVGLVLDERVVPGLLVVASSSSSPPSRIVACCSGSSVSRRTSWVSGEM